MPGAGRQHRDVTGFDLQFFALLATEAHPRLARRDAEHLVDLRVIMHERKDGVVPEAVTPIVAAKRLFDRRSGIASVERAFVHEKGQAIIRHRAVIGEEERERLVVGGAHACAFGLGTKRRTAGAKMFSRYIHIACLGCTKLTARTNTEIVMITVSPMRRSRASSAPMCGAASAVIRIATSAAKIVLPQ